GLIPMLGFTRGPIYPMALYAIFPVSLGIVLLWKSRQNTQALYRRQVTLIIVSAIPPLLVFIFYMIGFRPFPNLKYLDLNAFLYPLWGVGIWWAAYRYRLFELAPIAREVLIEHLSDGVLVFDNQTRLVDANPVAMKIMDWTQPPIGQSGGQVFAAWKDLHDVYPATGAAEAVKIEIQHIVGGERLFFDMCITPLQDEMERNIGHLIVIHDITALKQLEEQLLELSLIDELTGLNNRRGFYVLAAQFIQMVKRMNLKAALIFVDLDEMKTINDTFGHAEGDRALVDTASLLRDTSRSSDILARFGGDEFVALVIESEDNGAEMMLTRLEKKIIEFNAQEDRKYPILVSFGVAHFCLDQPISLDELMEKADRGMYEQKQTKKRIGTVA
ncbi:MAG: diguanylate cyclase, partial [Chloroflexi bacterium]|nr:diguanylate cyclase [Chloroflexota bacterium]